VSDKPQFVDLDLGRSNNELKRGFGVGKLESTN